MKTAAMILLLGACVPSLAVATEDGRVAAPRSDLREDQRTGGQEAQGPDAEAGGTVLGVQGTRFTLDGRPTFLLGISYYGGLGASEDSVRRDLDDVKRRGFNWLRVGATWSAFDRDVSAVNTDGTPREPYLRKLRWLVAEYDRRGLVVDVTLTRGEGQAGGAIRAIETLGGRSSIRPRRKFPGPPGRGDGEWLGAERPAFGTGRRTSRGGAPDPLRRCTCDRYPSRSA